MEAVVAEGRFFHDFFGGLFAVFGAAVALLASFFPVRRAMRVDPIETLRQE